VKICILTNSVRDLEDNFSRVPAGATVDFDVPVSTFVTPQLVITVDAESGQSLQSSAITPALAWRAG
jgi:hypothetical protein